MILRLVVLCCLLFSQTLWAQSIVDQIDSNPQDMSGPDALTEKILRISGTKTIFIITNNNSMFNKGDFISIVFEGKLTARALIAKVEGSNAGIKILKIYSLRQWNKLRANLDIQIVRGDDRFFLVKERQQEENPSVLTAEEELFDSTTFLEEDGALVEEDRNRIIKNDNVVSFSLGFVEASTSDGNIERYTQPTASWAYQIENDFWIELNYGRNILNGFPSEDIDTVFNNLTFKLKYSISAPFYSIIKPYAGYQRTSADSPNAGENDVENSRTQQQLQNELDDVDKLEKNRLIFGVTILKRLVPGWFIRADLGLDTLSAGLALEF